MMKRMAVAVVLLVISLGSYGWSQTADVDTLISEGDKAYAKFENKTAAEFYSQALKLDSTNYEATWKLSRAYLDMGEKLEKKDERARFFKKGEELARKAIKLEPDEEKGHLYLSIALGRVALDAGAKERVQMSKDIKAEVEKAIELNPNDYLAWHVLARWNRKMATLSWIEKKFANIFLGGIPKGASLQNAVDDFKKAIELNPGFINNYYQLGLTYQDMDKDQLAIEQYKKVEALPVTNWEDPKHKEEAKKLLKKLQ